MKTLGKQLKEWRGKKKLTQAAAATRLGVSLRTFQEWEQGRMAPRGFALSALMERIER
jgi:DNA-binding transcriptional regulator YiaG